MGRAAAVLASKVAIVVLTVATIDPAAAYEPLEWQKKAAIALPKQFSKIKQVQWTQDVSLWLTVRRDDTDWTAANGLVCAALSGAGKPPDAFVGVSYLDAERLPSMSVIAKANCEPQPQPAPAQAGDAESLGVMGADGVIRPE